MEWRKTVDSYGEKESRVEDEMGENHSDEETEVVGEEDGRKRRKNDKQHEGCAIIVRRRLKPVVNDLHGLDKLCSAYA